MFFNRKFNAFSLVELMMILLVASLITAALFPVVTKKHFRLPTLVNHGAYLCYYKDGKLHETKWAGKMKSKILFDRDTDNCVFVPPKKAGYFEISVIGGGGGGGDSGYTGGNWVSTMSDTEYMSPFGVTEDTLKGIPISKEEFDTYGGYLMGYANSLGSTDGGDIGYVTKELDSIPCLKYGTKPDCKTEYVNIPASCKAEWNADEKACYFYSCVDSKSCDHEDQPYDCSIWSEAYCAELEEIHESDCHKEQIGVENIPGTCKTVYEGGFKGTKRCVAEARTGAASCGSCTKRGGGSSDNAYGAWTESCEVKGTPKKVCDTRPIYKTVCPSPKCKSGKWVNSKLLEEKTCYTTVEKNCKYETLPSESWSSKSTGITEAQCNANSSSSRVEKEVCTDVIDKSTCKLEGDPLYVWPINKASGESGGSGANCGTRYSNEIKGQLGLSGAGGVTWDNSLKYLLQKGKDADLDDYPSSNFGRYFCSNNQAKNGVAMCANSMVQENCGSAVSYSYYKISKGTGQLDYVQANSASAGGGGAQRGYTNSGTECVDTNDGYSDDAVSGTCVAPATSSSDCRGTGDYGYCLRHYNKNGKAYGEVEENGQYRFKFGYDSNYIGMGGPGSPGEFKTTLIRSLKGVDTTIKVGRGGSAAALNSGSQGTSGSRSSFGDVLTAAGGEGGQGSLVWKDFPRLPIYNAEQYKKESTCYYYDVAFAKDPKTGEYINNQEKYKKIREKLDSEPNYCKGMINNQNAYAFFKLSNNSEAGKYPTPVGIFSSFLNIAFQNLTGGADNPMERFTKSGRGGKAGAVEHRCWAGRGEVIFEGEYMSSSVFVDKANADAVKNDHHWTNTPAYVPAGCRNDYSNIPAGPGADGAVLIKW